MPFLTIKNHIMLVYRRIIKVGPIIFLLFFAPSMYGETTEKPSGDVYQQQKNNDNSNNLYEKQLNMNDDIFGLSLDQLMRVEVAVASLFTEEDLVAGSSVSVINSEKWKRLGARRIHEVLNNETAVMTYPHFNHYSIVIRGFTNAYSYKGISTLVDGIPLNDLSNSTALFNLPNWEIGTLDRVELIKGPGSAIYGSDAFHGVFSMTSFESDKDTCIVEGAGGYPLYGDTNIKMSKGVKEDRIRIDATASISGQDDLDMEYEFNDNGVTGIGTRKYEYDSKAGILKIRTNPNEKLKIKAGIYATSWSGNDFPGLGSKYEGIRNKDLDSRDTCFNMGTGSISYMLDSGISIETGGYYWETRYDADMFINQDMFIRGHSKSNRSGAKLVLRQAENMFNIQWFLGYSYDHQKIDTASREIRTDTGQLVSDLGEQPQSGWYRDISSIFGQVKWGVADDRIFFLFGGRMDDYFDYTTQLTPRCGLIYLPTENSSLKALYGRAFMAPNAQNVFGSTGLLEGNPDIKPEIIDVYELIYMYRTIDWRFTLSGFYSLWKDAIITLYDPVTDSLFQANEGENISSGGEMSVFYSMDPFAVEFGLSYVHSKAIDSINITTLEKDDRVYAAFPEYSINLGLYYKLKPIDIDFYINNRVYLHMKAAPDFHDPDPDSLPDYYRMDCNISKKLAEKWEAILDIQDVLNRKNHIPSIDSNVKGHEEPGRSIVLRMTYTFL